MIDKSKPYYLSPIFSNNEPVRTCTINVYAQDDMPNKYIKSRFNSEHRALIEPAQRWGKLLYRLRVHPHMSTKSQINRAYAEKHGLPIIDIKLSKDDANGNQG